MSHEIDWVKRKRFTKIETSSYKRNPYITYTYKTPLNWGCALIIIWRHSMISCCSQTTSPIFVNDTYLSSQIMISDISLTWTFLRFISLTFITDNTKLPFAVQVVWRRYLHLGLIKGSRACYHMLGNTSVFRCGSGVKCDHNRMCFSPLIVSAETFSKSI